MVEQNSCHPLDDSLDIGISSRDAPPAHYSLHIESFSQLVQSVSDVGTENYESEIFEASGYKWKLSLYPNGDKSRNGEGHVSLYLVIAETGELPAGWEVKVNFKLFVCNQIQDTYSIFHDKNGKIWNFRESKTTFGFVKLLPLTVFKDPSNGFLVYDKCEFGVEVFVLNYCGRGECIPRLEKIEAKHTWLIPNFSSLQNDSHNSDDFTLGNHTWTILIYPKGEYRVKGEALSLYLKLSDVKMKGKVYVKYKLRIKDQLHANHKERTGNSWFGQEGITWGWKKFLTLSDLHKASMGFLANGTLVVQVEIISISSVKKFPTR